VGRRLVARCDAVLWPPGCQLIIGEWLLDTPHEAAIRR
jgi:hypothetical protein